MGAALAPAFPDAVLDAQAVFRAAMDALARPVLPRALTAPVAPPAPLTPELAALALTLADHETHVWLDGALDTAPVRDWLRFHTGTRLTDRPEAATFALIADPASMPALAAFAQGEPEYPDRSTTLLVAVADFDAGTPLTFAGPGMREPTVFAPAPLPDTFARQWRDNAGSFPLGVDILFVASGQVAGLPRSARPVGEG